MVAVSTNQTRQTRNQRRPSGGSRGGGRQRDRQDEYDRKVIDIRRVAKVRAGAKRLRFSAMVAVGDRKGKVCVSIGRGGDTRSAINKAIKYGTSHLVPIDLVGDTIPHEVMMKYRAGKVLIKPAGPGTGIIASGAVRAVMEVAGVRNVLTKQLGSDNPITNAYCAFEALKSLDKKRVMKKRAERAQAKLKKKEGEASPDTKKKE
jgi:small subunit ribosomal protein S5